jgi:hypothetical protein
MWQRIYLGLSLVLLLGISACAPGPKDVVEKFYRDVESGNINDALDQVSPRVIQTFGRPKLEQAIVSQNAAMKQAGGIKSVEFQGEQVTGDIAKVPAKVTMNNGQTQQQTVTLIKEQGAWKIDLTAK